MKIGFTGHRDFDNVKLVDRWINGIATRHPQATIITGAAIGADLLTAEATVRKDNLKSLVVLPMLPTVFTARWPLTLGDRLHAVLQKSDIYLMSEYREVSFDRLCELDLACADAEGMKYEIEFLTERNEYIVDNSDFMVAFWDGRQNGGTFNAVRYALQKGVEVYQGFPTIRRWKENGKIKEVYSFPEITKDEPLSDFFKTEEACIEGFERLQEKIGYTNFATYALSADMFASNGSVFERHDDTSVTFRETPLEPSNSLIATLKATLNVESDFAKDLARQIEEVGIEHKDYFVNQFKKNPFAALQELQFLSNGMSDLQENPEDVFSRVNVENVTLLQPFNDDPSEDDFDEMEGDQIICDPSTAWHRVDETFRTSIDPALPPKPNPVFENLLAKARTRTPKAGKELYALQKVGRTLSYEQWNQIWAEYKGKALPRFGEGISKWFLPGPPPDKPLVITAMPPQADWNSKESSFIEDPNYVDNFEKERRERQRPKKLRRINPLSERALKAKALLNGSQHKFIPTGVFCTHCEKEACPKGCFGFVPKLIPGMMRISRPSSTIC